MWNLEQLRADVERVHGLEQRKVLSPVLEAVWSRFYAAEFHFHEANRLMKPFAERADESSFAALELALGIDSESYQKMDAARRQAGAHIVAMLQALHAVSDNMAHAIYFALNMASTSPMKDRDISATGVVKRLPIGELKDALLALSEGPDAIYLSAVVNYSKHRALVSVPFGVNFTSDGPPHGLKLGGFNYDGQWHPERWAADCLKAQFERVAQGMQRLGAALNKAASV